jgi:hypothetical protein
VEKEETAVASISSIFAPADRATLKAAVNSCVPSNGDGSAWAASTSCAIGEWDVSRVTSLLQLFDAKQSFNQDLSKWDVSNVVNF